MCTGNTTHTQRKKIRLSVYPCVYREPGIKNDKKTSMSRFIPVCTGNIHVILAGRGITAVYPCVHREHFIFGIDSCLMSGLSLCAQGTSVIWFYRFRGARFIPVCTGNITESINNFIIDTVYPCVHREHNWYLTWLIRCSGLSLCAQGTYQL